MAILFRLQCVNPSGAETQIFWDRKVNTMADDALASHDNRPSACMILNMQGERINSDLKKSASSKFWKMIENANVFSCFLKWIKQGKG